MRAASLTMASLLLACSSEPAQGPDAGPVDAPAPDVQVQVDAGADVAPEVGADAAPEAAVDAPGDQGPEAPPPCPDTDGDGHRAASCGGDDCDDSNRLRFPGQMELCDGIDGNCDGVADGYPDGRHDPIADARCVERVGGTTSSMHACELGSWTPAQQRCPGGTSGARAWCTWVDRMGGLHLLTEDGAGGLCGGM